MTGLTGPDARAWGWVAHLRDGGTTPWRDWSGTAEPSGAVLPGAQQLELARRVNKAGRPSTELLDRVLAVDPSRRSRPPLPLLGGPPVAAHGPRPADPGLVRATELVDLVAVLLAHELATLEPPPPPDGVRRPWATRYRLRGDPELGRELRRHLTARGRPPTPSGSARVVVVGTDLGTMLADQWTHRALGEGAGTWEAWCRRAASRDRLPRRLDLAGTVEQARHHRGRRGVRLVTDPTRATRATGLRRPYEPPPPLGGTAVDLGRRVVAALRPVVPPETRRLLVSEVLRPRLAGLAGPPPAVPAEHREWLEAQASRLVERLAGQRGRYPVSGSLELLLPGDRPGAEAIRPRDTLASGIGLLLASDGRTTAEEAT